MHLLHVYLSVRKLRVPCGRHQDSQTANERMLVPVEVNVSIRACASRTRHTVSIAGVILAGVFEVTPHMAAAVGGL
jgi:hypothetical protein